jgi:hypothetical protein
VQQPYQANTASRGVEERDKTASIACAARAVCDEARSDCQEADTTRGPSATPRTPRENARESLAGGRFGATGPAWHESCTDGSARTLTGRCVVRQKKTNGDTNTAG